MPHPPMPNRALDSNTLADCTVLELAQALAEKSRIAEKDWHRRMSHRPTRAQEQIATALVYLLKDQPEEALIRLQHAVGWLDRSIAADPCPTHGEKRQG